MARSAKEKKNQAEEPLERNSGKRRASCGRIMKRQSFLKRSIAESVCAREAGQAKLGRVD